ncbi:hypothetical protein, partial [Phascolarctobacterium sp.]|uniref:hypothetical protein n=1 Tax=Phascolarctobacterium sp. TaxID=2049039 RepID=UPI0025D2A9CE
MPGSRTASKAKQDLPQCAEFFVDFLSRKSKEIFSTKEIKILRNKKVKKQIQILSRIILKNIAKKISPFQGLKVFAPFFPIYFYAKQAYTSYCCA